MASVFTYDPEPPRISSPWSTPPILAPQSIPPEVENARESYAGRRFGGLLTPPPVLLAEYGISKLQAEPQDGPTEYKLHLLLRPRRAFSASSTGTSVSGSRQSGPKATHVKLAVTGHASKCSSADTTPTRQSRQNRLQQLTTQLLWRLQQSSPYHSSSTAGLVIPVLPDTEADVAALPTRPERLMPGLEESSGALYEIGVSDDGSFVGLTEDELSESLTNLVAMAASLGCKVEILRTVIVGDCEWHETVEAAAPSPLNRIRKEILWVAEVLVLPGTAAPSKELITDTPLSRVNVAADVAVGGDTAAPTESDARAEQLRISLTGGTTSGKSSLLGTLLTSTLDNGRGKSRLSLLKHRHEIASGVTSSVAPELIGYSEAASSSSSYGRSRSNIINYACGNVSTWNDVHNEVGGGRLVLLTDTAGHPRFRRTTVRGLVSWAPHWTLCCVAADEASPSNIKTATGEAASPEQELSASPSKAYLELCLKLDLPLVVVITKQDLAEKLTLRQTLSNVLSSIKAAGRKPVMMVKPSPVPTQGGLVSISSSDEIEVQAAFEGGENNSIVPILLTSAVSGSGVAKLHALLRNLPIPAPRPPSPKNAVNTLFHVDEVFIKPAAEAGLMRQATSMATTQESSSLVVLSGLLRHGTISVGDILSIGPFTPDPTIEDLKALRMQRTGSSPGRGSGSFATRDHEVPFERNSTPPSFSTTPTPFPGEYLAARVVSVRNLRLPKTHLLKDQVGTVGIELVQSGRRDDSSDSSNGSGNVNGQEGITNGVVNAATSSSAVLLKIRKGMVLGRPSSTVGALTACTALKVRFDVRDYHVMEPGALFIAYVGSVRATSKIVTVEIANISSSSSSLSSSYSVLADEGPDIFGLDDLDGAANSKGKGNGASNNIDGRDGGDKEMIDVVFQFLTYREWIEVGAQVLVMPGMALEGGVGLEGFVGRVTDVLN